MEASMLICAVVILICLVSGKISGKIGVPVLVFFIVVGMIFGSDGIVKIPLDNYVLVEKICTIALVAIMFYGGFSTNWDVAKPVAKSAIALSSLGVMITAFITFLCCYCILHIEVLESCLIGAVISSTDAASVFSIFRSKNLNLKGGLASLLEVESGSNDPVSYMLTIIALSLMEGRQVDFVWVMVLKQVLIGVLIGVLVGQAAIYGLKKTTFIAEGSDSIFVVAAVIISYALTSVLGGNGYLSVYLSGIILGNSKIAHKGSLVHFFDGITKLAQIAVFFLLGLLSFPSVIPEIFGKALIIAGFLTFVARPVAVFLILGKKYGMKEKLFVSWAGLRGAASIVFAIMASVSDAYTKNDVFHIVFCISLLSVTIQGTLLPYIAKKLDLIDNENNVLKTFNDYQEEASIMMMRLFIPRGHNWENRTIQEVSLPTGSLALMIKRDSETLIPKGDTIIRANDSVILSVPAYEQMEDVKLRELEIGENHEWKDQRIEALDLPDDILVAMIKRGDENIIPSGKTKIHQGDIVVVYD